MEVSDIIKDVLDSYRAPLNNPDLTPSFSQSDRDLLLFYLVDQMSNGPIITKEEDLISLKPVVAKNAIGEILEERGSRYGSFEDNATTSQELKVFLDKSEAPLSYVQREALEMIFHKISRILNGDPDYDDSWRDIAGYAELVVRHLNEKSKD